MLLYILATCCVVLSSGYKVSQLKPNVDDLPKLEWPKQFKMKGTITHLTTGLVEDFTVWKETVSSRVDYNKGAVRRITQMDNSLSDGDKYEIHPETTENEYNVLKCHEIGAKGQVAVTLDTLLPELDVEYKVAGYETVLEKETVKLVNIQNEKVFKVDRTIWAVYGKQNGAGAGNGWTPVRFQKKTYANKVGALDDNTVYEYFDFNVGAIDSKVFDVDDFECDPQTHDGNSEDVIGHLLFIDPENSQHVDHVFNSFKNKFQRQYAHENEHKIRKALFQNSMRLVSSVNRRNLGYKLAINQFADRTPEEMKKHTGLLQRPEGHSGNIPFPYTEATLREESEKTPKEYDARMYGIVSPIKDQGSCGSCWTFGTTVALEGALARAHGGRPISLANQAIVDCAWDNAYGCNGGTAHAAYEFMMKHGVPTDEEYGPYTNNPGYCNIRNMTKLYTIKGFTDVTPNNTEALKVAVVNHGPLSVSLEITKQLEMYSSGIYYEAACGANDLNHGVALVGYSERNGELFWILKNSWGTSWGIDGYMFISAKNNNCGVQSQPAYVVVE